MKIYTELTPIIKDCIWELKDAGKVITVKNVYDQAKGLIEFNELPRILEYLNSVKENYLHTEVNGYLELHPFGKAKVSDLISRE